MFIIMVCTRIKLALAATHSHGGRLVNREPLESTWLRLATRQGFLVRYSLHFILVLTYSHGRSTGIVVQVCTLINMAHLSQSQQVNMFLLGGAAGQL